MKKFFNHPWFSFRLSLIMILIHLTIFCFAGNLADVVLIAFWIGWAIQCGFATRTEILYKKMINIQEHLNVESCTALAKELLAQGKINHVNELNEWLEKYENATKN